MPLLDRIKDDCELAAYMLKVLCLTSGFNLYLLIYFFGLFYHISVFTEPILIPDHRIPMFCHVLSYPDALATLWRCQRHAKASVTQTVPLPSVADVLSLPFSDLCILSFRTRYRALVKATQSGDGWFSLQNHTGETWTRSVMVVQVKS